MRRVVFALLLPVVSACHDPRSAAPPAGVRDVVIGTSMPVPSTVYGAEQRVTVYLPEGYEGGSDRYPVIYATHSWPTHLVGTVEGLSGEHIPPSLLVYLETYDSGDLLPTPIDERGESGGADKLLRFFQEDLIPFIDARYRTQPFRVFHSGSWGGVFCLHALLSRPDIFQGCIAATPWVIYDGDARHMVTTTGQYLRSGSFQHNYLFVALGNDPDPGLREEIEALADTMLSVHPEGLDFEYRYLPQEDHYSIGHKAFFDGLRWLFREWALVPDSVLEGGAQAVAAYRAAVEEHFGFPVGLNWLPAYSRGFLLLDAGDPAGAVEMFGLCVDLAPHAPGCHEALGRAHEAAGAVEEALASYQRALDLATEQGWGDLARFRDPVQRLTSGGSGS